MSDSDSYRSATPSGDIDTVVSKTDEILNDHRHQALSLPVRGSVSNAGGSTPPSVSRASHGNNATDGSQGPMLTVPSTESQEKRKSGKSGRSSHHKFGSQRTRSGSSYGPDLNFMKNLRTEFYLKNDDEYALDFAPTSRDKDNNTLISGRRHRGSRSHSVSEHLSSLNAKEGPDEPERKQNSGILKHGVNVSSGKKNPPRRNSVMENFETDLASPLMKVKTNDTTGSEGNTGHRRERRPSRSSIESDADSRASRSSQETEEDVCFPMLREHVRIRGIDFDEIEEFIKEEEEEKRVMREQSQFLEDRMHSTNESIAQGRTTGAASVSGGSTAALKYTPKHILKKTNSAFSKIKSNIEFFNEKTPDINEKSSSDSMSVDDADLKRLPEDTSSSENVKFGGARINGDFVAPERFSFFSSESEETVHAPDISSLLEPGQSVRDLFRNGEETWWLDCTCPTDAEMKMIAKAFGIHPLTAEDIRMQETREKVELFRNYYFVCFHTFEPDYESEDYLEPINVYIVVFREGILSFHFSPISHPANVRRRVRQLRDYVDVSADWLCYALIDDITDGFAPVITGIEYEADAIEDSVFVAREQEFSYMLQRIGEARRKVMTLMRLLSGKADVIKMFAKRCQDEAFQIHQAYGGGASTPNVGGYFSHGYYNKTNVNGQSNPPPIQQNVSITQPRADIALYLGDIQDHVVTMFQNLVAYEKIFSRSHSNYLAQLQVESFYSNNKVTEMLSRVTLIGTLLVPLNLVTGLFGMNVEVPGQSDHYSGLNWFFGILGIMVLIVLIFFLLARIWLKRLDNVGTNIGGTSTGKSLKSFAFKNKTKEAAKSVISTNKYD